jgi:hypothetical protein
MTTWTDQRAGEKARPRLPVVGDCLIRPAEHRAIAARHVERCASRAQLGRWRSTADARAFDEADLMSYLLFDGEYAAELIDLGYRDAEAMEPELFRFFSS